MEKVFNDAELKSEKLQMLLSAGGKLLVFRVRLRSCAGVLVLSKKTAG